MPPGGIHGFRNEADAPASHPDAVCSRRTPEAYFEGLAHLAELSDDERREWFIKNDNFFVE